MQTDFSASLFKHEISQKPIHFLDVWFIFSLGFCLKMPTAPITPSHNSQTNTLLRFPFTALQISAVDMELTDT